LPSFANDYKLRFFVLVVFELLRWSSHKLRTEEMVRDQAVPGSLYSLVLHNFELLEKEVKHCHLKLPYKYVHVQLPMTLKLDGFFEDLLSGK
jgi:hypothetical protein